MATYAVTYRYVEQHDDARLAQRPLHREWLSALREVGRLVNAGPFADGTGALLLFTADTPEQVQELLREDPYPPECVESTVLGEWMPLFPLA